MAPDKNDKPFRLDTEVDFAIECIIHGNISIRGNVRALPLGHGRAYIDLGGAQCNKCGSSINLTIRTVVTKWDNIPADKVRALLKAALEAEMGVPVDAEPGPESEEESEEVTVPVHASAPVASESPTVSPFGRRPRLQ